MGFSRVAQRDILRVLGHRSSYAKSWLSRQMATVGSLRPSLASLDDVVQPRAQPRFGQKLFFFLFRWDEMGTFFFNAQFSSSTLESEAT